MNVPFALSLVGRGTFRPFEDSDFNAFGGLVGSDDAQICDAVEGYTVVLDETNVTVIDVSAPICYRFNLKENRF